MFDIIIQRNNSEDRHVDKDLTTLATFSGELRDACSVVDPVILIEAPVTSFASANYMTIATFGRSYFIREIVSVAADLTEIRAHVDVLTSFAAEIRANKGIVLRQAHDWNLYLADDVIRCYANPIVHTMAFPSGFSGSSYVLLVAGRRNAGVDIGQGGYVSGDGVDGGGAGNSGTKSTSGLLAYATAFIGTGEYWFGTFGQVADATLLAWKRAQYSQQYDLSVVGGEAFEDQYGARVFDCVGLIKAYRWSDDPSSTPVYNASQDVNVQGLYAQCTRVRGTIDPDHLDEIPAGAVLFYSNFDHCGVNAGSGRVIEARGHAYGVQLNELSSRTGFSLWGVPDWMLAGSTIAPDYRPLISTQPSDVTTAAGTTASFTVVASSPTGEIAYQWQYSTDGGENWADTALSGNKTATLTFNATSGRNGYKYRCVVSNAIGSVISDAATLTVT